MSPPRSTRRDAQLRIWGTETPNGSLGRAVIHFRSGLNFFELRQWAEARRLRITCAAAASGKKKGENRGEECGNNAGHGSVGSEVLRTKKSFLAFGNSGKGKRANFSLASGPTVKVQCKWVRSARVGGWVRRIRSTSPPKQCRWQISKTT